MEFPSCVRNSGPVTFTATSGYSKVCGKGIAYQHLTPDGFAQYLHGPVTLDTYYVDGVSLTYGSPRHHLWTFAAARAVGPDNRAHCPCISTNTTSIAFQPPAFVGSDQQRQLNNFHADDPLWDGAGCGPLSTCCSFNNPPWFYKQLSQPTTS